LVLAGDLGATTVFLGVGEAGFLVGDGLTLGDAVPSKEIRYFLPGFGCSGKLKVTGTPLAPALIFTSCEPTAAVLMAA